MKTLTALIEKLLTLFVTLLFAALLGCVIWQVISRYLLTTPSTVTDELARLLFIWVGLLGAAYAAGQKKHLSIDLLGNSLNRSNLRKVKLLLEILTAFFAMTVMIAGGGRLVVTVLATGQLTPALEIPMGWVYLVIPVSGVLIFYYSLVAIKSHTSSRT